MPANAAPSPGRTTPRPRPAVVPGARLRPELPAVMYPRPLEFRALRRELDLDGVGVSDLARRLGP
ncbi:hypothetical protein [Streptomyces sp. MA5143a]|uniref:hypothetical protein n=1 Tax=Streptomyces sp. MA5143a TaxID=2083010 RepID=UPI000D1A553F|nr:hypothetical protein [Streptomyces sp. MA5143a]